MTFGDREEQNVWEFVGNGGLLSAASRRNACTSAQMLVFAMKNDDLEKGRRNGRHLVEG